MAALQDELRGSLDECWTHVSALFAALAQRTELAHGVSDEESLRQTAAHYRALEALDKKVNTQLKRAADHAENQRRLDEIVARVQARDASMRAGITRLATLRDELTAMVLPAVEEVSKLEAAEADPLPYRDILEYAQRLARYTSAPPGYRLGGAPAAAEYNSETPRAAGYYNPTIPSMPQELPFPSDVVMRQGILYEDAATAAGATLQQETGAAPAEADTVTEVHDPAPPAHAAIDAFGAVDDDDDDLDLDLNP